MGHIELPARVLLAWGDTFVSDDPHDDNDLFRCPRIREFIAFDTGIAVTKLVYDRIVY